MYSKTWSGLASSYVAAVPFFRDRVVAETVSSVVVFGLRTIASHGPQRVECSACS